jgi:hypothetical protein
VHAALHVATEFALCQQHTEPAPQSLALSQKIATPGSRHALPSPVWHWKVGVPVFV